MTENRLRRGSGGWGSLAAVLAAGVLFALASSRSVSVAGGPGLIGAIPRLPNGSRLSLPPLGRIAAAGRMPVNLVLSPDGKYLVSTSLGFSSALTVFDARTGSQVSQLQFPVSAALDTGGLYYGLAFGADGLLYASQGLQADILANKIAVLSLQNGQLQLQSRSIATGDLAWPAGIAADRNGYLYVANRTPPVPLPPIWRPGSLTIYRTDGTALGTYEFSDPDTNPTATETYPLGVAALGDGSKAYIASERDGGVYVVDTSDKQKPAAGSVPFIATGAGAGALLLNRAQTLLFVANSGSDTVSVIDTSSDQVVAGVPLRPAAAGGLPGAGPTGVALSPDEKTLYVSLADMNAVALVDATAYELEGYLPAGWYPTAVAVSGGGNRLFVANGYGSQPRVPNPTYNWLNPDVLDPTHGPPPNPGYVLNLIPGNVQTMSLPVTPAQLQAYTAQVVANNNLPPNAAPPPNPLLALSRQAGKIRHVLYVIKENRSYDQILGDIGRGNSSPALAIYGVRPPRTSGSITQALPVTPNQHALANRFVLLDNNYCNGPVSSEGWPWCVQGQANPYVVRTTGYINHLNAIDYEANYNVEGQNGFYITGGFPAKDPDGNRLSDYFFEGAPAVPDVARAAGGYLWDRVREKELSYRNYGVFYSSGLGVDGIPIIPDNYPCDTNLQPPGHNGNGISDWDFRAWDPDFAESDAGYLYYQQTHNPACLNPTPVYQHTGNPANPKTHSRFQEWQREFRLMLAADPTGNSVPAFMMLRLGQDHTLGGLPSNIPVVHPGVVKSPRSYIADNDYAVGQLVQEVSRSPIWTSTAIFVIEDDAQYGPDHVDAHRSPAFAISPYIRQGMLDSTFYNTTSVLRTIECLLNLNPMSQHDAFANPLGFDAAGRPTGLWTGRPMNSRPFSAVLPPLRVICENNPPLVALRPGDPRRRLAEASMKLDFRRPDAADPQQLNEILWQMEMGPNAKMPAPRIARFRLAAAQPGGPARGGDDDD